MSQLTFGNALQNKINPSPLQTIGNRFKKLGNTISTSYNNTIKPAVKDTLNVTRNLGAPQTTTQTTPSWQKSLDVNNAPPGPGAISLNGYNSGMTKNPTLSKPPTTKPTPPVVDTPPKEPTPPVVGSVPSYTSTGESKPAVPENTYTKSADVISKYSSGTGNPAVNTAVSGLQGIATNQTPEVKKAQEEYSRFSKASPFMLSDVKNNANVAAEVSVGRGQALGQTLSAEQQALQGNVANALAGQGQQITAGNEAGQMAQGQQTAQIGAAGTAGALTKPEAGASYFGSPETGGLVGGREGGTGNQLIDGAVSNAVQQIKNGSSTTDAMATLSQFGPVGQQALIKEMQKYDPNWSITASNAIAQQNMTQGQQYQGEATQLNTTLQQLDKLTPVVTDFIQKSGLNDQENPFYNKAINEYKSQLHNPADVASLNAMMADVKTYTAQILGSSGLNPTEVSATVNSFDPSLLNGRQLTSFLANLKNLGQVRLQPIQQTAQQSYGSGRPSMGGLATPSISSSYSAPNSSSELNTNNPVIQGLIGGGMNVFGGVENFIKGFASSILK